MTDDARHGHGAVAPGWAKGEIEFIIFDIGIARNTSLQTRELEANVCQNHQENTVVTCPPLRW